jgi:hypothetical protein
MAVSIVTRPHDGDTLAMAKYTPTGIIVNVP